MADRQVKLGDFLTEEEMKRAITLFNEARPGTFATRCADEIIAPVIDRINVTLGQENDPKYLAYMVEYVCNLASKENGAANEN